MNTMTREQILAMPAGREIDRLIGEHVFGHDPAAMNETWVLMRPRYSGDMNAAWIVVETMNLERLYLSALQFQQRCEVAFGTEMASSLDHIPATTMPLAICRAALLAKLNTEGK